MASHDKGNTYVGEVTLKVQDLDRMLTFYKEMIGFQVLEQTEGKAILTANGKTALLSLEQREDLQPKQQRTAGLYHFALLLPNRSDLAKVLIHLAKNNVQLGASDHSVSEAIYLSDPEGNGIEIYSDRPEDTWTWNNGEVGMVTEPLDAENLIQEAKGESWNGLPVGTVMGHIHLHVSNLQETEKFYHEGLGFESVLQFGSQALFMSTGKYHHHIGLNTWAGAGVPASPENSPGLKQFILEYPDEEKRNQAVENLKNIGADVREESGIIRTTDPSGNVIQLNVQSV
ncbi:MAG TPA: VOC family protein [Candidatus Avamphibacillus sp.]|nr:VOC family protein [Candidatus Avamphibacillus sp.]